MAMLPDFTAADRKRLRELGVCKEQIEELRYAAVWVRSFAVAPPAPRGEVAELLADINHSSSELLRKLTAMVLQPSAAYGVAHALLEERYWQGNRMNDSGPTLAHHLIPRLQALSDAGRDASQALPPGQSRHRSADPRPIGRIVNALREGWRKAHGSNARSYAGHETFEEMTADAKAHPPPLPFPRELLPSTKEKGAFREVVGICYRAVGGNPDPIAAIRGYLSAKKERHVEAIAAFERGIAEVGEAAHRKRRLKKQSALNSSPQTS